MASISYAVNVTGGDVQDFTITGGGTNQVVSEADTDAAVQAFASSLSSVTGLVVNSVHKVTTTTTTSDVVI
jgi:hypothetical protein